MTVPCQDLNPWRQKRLMLRACARCRPTQKAYCAQLAADSGETSGVWGGLDLGDPAQRRLLPPPSPATTPVPLPQPRATGIDPDARQVSHHTSPSSMAPY